MEEITLQKIWEKLIQVETNLSNHLSHHDTLTRWFLAPILVGTIMIFITLLIKVVLHIL